MLSLVTSGSEMDSRARQQVGGELSCTPVKRGGARACVGKEEPPVKA